MDKLDPNPHASLIAALPKAELHLHIEGTLEPELIFDMARRNGLTLPYATVDELRSAYAFVDLQSFLDLYYAATDVLRTADDFHDMTQAYLRRAASDNVRHVEIFFDPQSHTSRGIGIETVFAGIASALREAQQVGLSSRLILCFLRHLSEKEAFEALEDALPLRDKYADLWVGIGLDSSERGHPPEKFARVFARCRELGFACVAHAGEEGPPSYIRDALDVLKVVRIDHGVRCEEDPALVARLAREQIPLTVCPLSNLRLCVVRDLRDHNLARLLRAGLRVTANSDDPAYFGGYIGANYLAVASALQLTRAEIIQLARNGFSASWLSEGDKARHLADVDRVAASF
jgi:adenosine deaminase